MISPDVLLPLRITVPVWLLDPLIVNVVLLLPVIPPDKVNVYPLGALIVAAPVIEMGALMLKKPLLLLSCKTEELEISKPALLPIPDGSPSSKMPPPERVVLLLTPLDILKL